MPFSCAALVTWREISSITKKTTRCKCMSNVVFARGGTPMSTIRSMVNKFSGKKYSFGRGY